MSVNYYDNYDFIINFANDSLAYRNMTGYDSKYTGLIAEQSVKGYLTCREDGIAWYDNNARWYDPIFMRFTTPDPLQEKYPHLSPYSHCANNPFMLVDPSGKEIINFLKA